MDNDAAKKRLKLGIDDSQQDVYESPDVPDVALPSANAELEAARRALREARPNSSAAIDRAPLEPGPARDAFLAKDTASSRPPQTDFSHEAHARRREEWRLLGRRDRMLESPEERYMRLKAEVSELEADLELAATQDAQDMSNTLPFPSQLQREVKELAQRLKNVSIPPSSSSSTLRPGKTSCYQDAISHVKQLAKGEWKQAKAAPQHESEAAMARSNVGFLELEGKVSRLEQAIGDGDLASLFPSLSAALDGLEARLGLIDPSRLEAAGKAVQALEQRAERARGGAGAGLGTAAEGAAVILERWDSVAAVLPVLISRMRTLKDVHEAASSAAADVSSLVSVQAATEASLKRQDEVLETARESLASNMLTMVGSMEAVEARIRALEAKP